MELIIILLPIILFMVGINEIKYRLKIRREAVYYVDLQRKIEQIEAKETELIQQERERNLNKEQNKPTITLNQREKVLLCIAAIFVVLFILYHFFVMI